MGPAFRGIGVVKLPPLQQVRMSIAIIYLIYSSVQLGNILRLTAIRSVELWTGAVIYLTLK